MADPQPLVKPSDDLTTGLTTDRWFDHGLRGRRVTWIAWDSPFRGTRLAVGDAVLEADGVPCDPAQTDRREEFMVGNYAEGRGFAEDGRKAGEPVRLLVWRDHERFEVEAPIATENFYYDPEGRRALAPGGPHGLGNDGFGSAWSGWDEELTKKLSAVLDQGWRGSSFNSRQVLADLAEYEPRVRLLAERYPGPYAETTAADLAAAMASARGTLWPAEGIDLSWRERGERLAEEVRQAAVEAERAFTATLGERVIPAAPTPDPVENDPEGFAGKVVHLERVGPRSQRMDAGHPWYCFGDLRSGWWFLDANSPGCRAFHMAVENYRQLVDMSVPLTYRFYAEVLPLPRMMVVDGRVATGLTLRLAAAVVADRVFITVPANPAEGARFAGEELLAEGPVDPPPAGAPPRATVEAAIAALKLGRRELWRDLFADWSLDRHWNGAISYSPLSFHSESSFFYAWDFARKALSKEVHDLRIVYEGPVTTLLAPPEPGGGPTVEECRIEVEHVGLFDGEHRSFRQLGLHRTWPVQRVDGGPWRLAVLQGL